MDDPRDPDGGSSSSDSSRSMAGAVRDYIAQYITHSDRSLLKELMFRVYVRRQSVSRLQILVMAFGTLVLLIWPSDFFLFRESRVIWIFSGWRIFTFLSMWILFGLISGLGVVKERNFWILNTYLALYFAATGYLFGEIRGLSFPWFYIAYMIPMFSVAVGVDLVPRLVATTTVTAAYVAAYMYNVPGALQYPDLHQFMPLTASSIFLFTMIGHSIYHLDRANFFQSRLVKNQRQRVRELARRDQLTGLFNRREFEERYHAEFDRADRYESSLAVMMVDLDHFKEVNDTYGHQAGDEVLGVMGEVLQDMTRQVDITGRYGGEEFAVVLPETDLASARRAAERINQELRRQTFEGDEDETFTVTCSLGLAELSPEDEDAEALLQRADEALYEAKSAGRDRVAMAPSP